MGGRPNEYVTYMMAKMNWNSNDEDSGFPFFEKDFRNSMAHGS